MVILFLLAVFLLVLLVSAACVLCAPQSFLEGNHHDHRE